MKHKLDKADLWLINEICEALKERFNLKQKEAEHVIKNSNFMLLLKSNPEDVHHDSPRSWVNTITRQMKLKEMTY